MCAVSRSFLTAAATTLSSTLSLHDALPIWPAREPAARRALRARRHPLGRSARPRRPGALRPAQSPCGADGRAPLGRRPAVDRKSTRLNSSHTVISYAVFCLKKKKDQASPAGDVRGVPFFLNGCGDHAELHSFPTRRSSDLAGARTCRAACASCSPTSARPKRATSSPRGASTCSITMRRRWTCAARSPTRCRSEEHTSELQSHSDLVCRLLLEKKKRPGFPRRRCARCPVLS